MRQALKDRQREIERANELEERSGERKRKFDVHACREKRAQAEAQVLIDEKKAAQDEILRLTLVASADAAGMDAVAFKVRPRRPTSVPSLQYDSCPSHDDVGRFFVEFEAIRDAPRRRHRLCGKFHRKCQSAGDERREGHADAGKFT